MNEFTRVPVTIAVFAAAAVLLSGCIVYDAAATAVDAGATVVDAGATAVGAAGDVVTSPFGGDSGKGKDK
ncbi:MAG TPA: hypothetical protein VHC40_09045 [Rhizomicrobium sp.]|nr:hypothetical protein [Rhizomicrobium sp.]